MGGFGDGFGRHLEALGASWVVLGGHFLTLVFGMVFKSALGGLWARFWIDVKGLGVDFGSILKGLGEVWGGFGEGLARIFEDSGRCWIILGYCGLLGRCFGLLLLAFAFLACCGLLWLLWLLWLLALSVPLLLRFWSPRGRSV